MARVPRPRRVGATKICMNVVAGSAAVDITIHDHIIVGKNGHTSFEASGSIGARPGQP